MTEDYYATLGVEPKSEPAVIRAAYLALMRCYHPDKNDSPAAVDRAHAIIAAFKVLGDTEKRLHYDWARRRAAEAAADASRSRFGTVPRAVLAAAAVLLLLVPMSFMRFPATMDDPPAVPTVPSPAVESSSIQVAKRVATATPFAAMAPVAAAKPEPVVEPPPVKQVEAQPRPSVDKVPLVRASVSQVLPPREPRQARKNARLEKPIARASASAKCSSVKPGAETSICNNDGLAALDRNVVAFYNQSLMFGAVANRGALLDARNNFLARREACRSDECLRSVHLGHLRELSAIVEKRPPQPPL